MEPKVRIFFAVAGLLCAITTYNKAEATTYDVNLAPNGVFNASQIGFDTGIGVFGVQFGYLTPFYSFNPGDVVDFGTITIGLAAAGDQYGGLSIVPGEVVAFYSPFQQGYIQDPQFYPIGCNTYSNPNCSSSIASIIAAQPAQPQNLIYTIPIDGSGVQIAILNMVQYTPPVPEPSTWAMMILGFACLGFLAYRRRPQLSFAAQVPWS